MHVAEPAPSTADPLALLAPYSAGPDGTPGWCPVSVLAAPALVLSGVDTVLSAMTRDAVGTAIAVTNGPLDRPAGGARLNWFLYRITPAVALMNMEPPQSRLDDPARPPAAGADAALPALRRPG